LSQSSQTVGKCPHSGCKWIALIQCKEIYEQSEFVVFFAMALDSSSFGASSGACYWHSCYGTSTEVFEPVFGYTEPFETTSNEGQLGFERR